MLLNSTKQKSTVVQIHKIYVYAEESCLSFVTVWANVEQSWKEKVFNGLLSIVIQY